MRDKFLRMTPELYTYMVDHGARQDAVLTRVEQETEALGSIAVMQIAPDQGALLTLLVQMIGARRALEIGTFTGYSAICIARGLPPDGQLICCEIDENWAAAAERNLRDAALDELVEVRLAPALDTLRELSPEEPFDFAFVDADKTSYADYYDEVLRLLRPGGVMVLDNVLLGGRVLSGDDDAAKVMSRLNSEISQDERVDCAMVGVADGITLVRKR